MDGAPVFQMRFNPGGEQLAAALDCEASVFLKTYGNTPGQLAEEYGPYAAASVFIGIYEPGGDAVGAVRLIRPTELGLKTLHDVARPPWALDVPRMARAARLDLSRTWDFTTLGARRGLRRWSALVSAGLFHGLVQTVRANDIPSAVMMIDERVRGLLALAGMTGQSMPGAQTQSYMGSLRCTPVYEHCQQAFDRQRQANPDGYRLFMQGIGLDGIAVPPPAAFRLQPMPAHPAGPQPVAPQPAAGAPVPA
jgi:N-acyl-L-homoserine lactone synthetase